MRWDGALPDAGGAGRRRDGRPAAARERRRELQQLQRGQPGVDAAQKVPTGRPDRVGGDSANCSSESSINVKEKLSPGTPDVASGLTCTGSAARGAEAPRSRRG